MSFVFNDQDDNPRDYWPPRRADGTPEAAHAATPLLSDDTDAYTPYTWPELLRLIAPAAVAVAAILAVAFYGWR